MKMALTLQTPSSCSLSSVAKTRYPHKLSNPTRKLTTIIRCLQDTDSESSSSSGVGFGSSTAKKQSSEKKKTKRVIRRAPVEKTALGLASEQDKAKAEEMMKNDSAFLLSWLGLGSIILLQGIALAASGFLPEKWDKFFVKYLYPSFTPTVALFVAGTVVYGVLKYLQNENLRSEK